MSSPTGTSGSTASRSSPVPAEIGFSEVDLIDHEVNRANESDHDLGVMGIGGLRWNPAILSLFIVGLLAKTERENVEPFYRPKPRSAARRPKTRPLRPLRISGAGGSVEDGADPQCKSDRRRASSGRHLPPQHRQR